MAPRFVKRTVSEQMGRARLEPETAAGYAYSPVVCFSLLKLPLKSEGEEAAGEAYARRSWLYVASRTYIFVRTEKDAAGEKLC